jgi:hypothetical protein
MKLGDEGTGCSIPSTLSLLSTRELSTTTRDCVEKRTPAMTMILVVFTLNSDVPCRDGQ